MMLAVAAGVAFVAMEGVTYLAHRFVMHGAGWVLHRSHHVPTARRLEANDWFPVVFGSLTVLAMAVGYQLPAPAVVAVTLGITAYGAAYAFVHDVYIHGRLGRMPRLGVLERLREAHGLHHRFGGEPYGMLFPLRRSLLRRSPALTGSAGRSEIGSVSSDSAGAGAPPPSLRAPR